MVTGFAERPIAPGLEQLWPLLLIAETGVSWKRLGKTGTGSVCHRTIRRTHSSISAGSVMPAP